MLHPLTAMLHPLTCAALCCENQLLRRSSGERSGLRRSSSSCSMGEQRTSLIAMRPRRLASKKKKNFRTAVTCAARRGAARCGAVRRGAARRGAARRGAVRCGGQRVGSGRRPRLVKVHKGFEQPGERRQPG